MKCARCRGVFYCSDACQRLDWKMHKRLCRNVPAPGVWSAAGSAAAGTETSTLIVTHQMPPSPPFSVIPGDVQLALLFEGFSCEKYKDLSEAATQLGRQMPALLQKVRKLLDEGARADVMVSPLAKLGVITSMSMPGLRVDFANAACALTVACQQPAWHPLLKLILERTRNPPINCNVSCAGMLVSHGRPLLESPLGLVIAIGDVVGLKLLLAHGADPNRVCGMAVQLDAGHSILLLRPLAAICVNTANFTPSTAIAMADALIAAGADINAPDLTDNQATPLLLALNATVHVDPRENRGKYPLWLIQHGADVNAAGKAHCNRPLDAAAALGLIEVMEAIVAKGGDPQPVPIIGCAGGGDEMGTHYVQAAIVNHVPDVLRFARRHGVDLLKLTTLGDTAIPMLAHAVEAGSPMCLAAMLEIGADVNQKFTHEGRRRTALDLESRRNGPIIRQVLFAAGAKTYKELKAAEAAAAAQSSTS